MNTDPSTATLPRRSWTSAAGPVGRVLRYVNDPWRRRWGFESIVWVYIAWSLFPVLIAVLFSFNAGRSRTAWQGFSLRWWFEDPVESLLHNPDLRRAVIQSLKLSLSAVVIAVPLGTLFAIGIDRWRGRVASTAQFGVLFAFVVPEIVLALGLFHVFTRVTENVVPRGTLAQIIGVVTWQIAYPVIIVRARLLSIGREYEEAAMDLGASPVAAVRRVLLPLLVPAILVSAGIVFADSLDNFVTVRYLSADATSEPVSVKIYTASRQAPSPAVNAAGTTLLTISLSGVGLAFLAQRLSAGGWRGRGRGGRNVRRRRKSPLSKRGLPLPEAAPGEGEPI